MLTTLRVLKRQILINTKNVTFLNMAGLSQGPQPITSARSTVIAAEVAVKVNLRSAVYQLLQTEQALQTRI